MIIKFVKFAIAIYTATILLVLVQANAFAEDADALLSKVDFIRAPGADFTFHLKIITADNTEQEMEVSIHDTSKGLIRYVKPANAVGRAILYAGENMWIYVPGTRQALRISPQQRILGGVSNADVARTAYAVDYKVEELTETGDEIILTLGPISKSAAYKRIDLTIKPSGKPLQAVFFAGGERKIKTMYFEEYSDVLGELRPTKFRIIDHLEGDTITTMFYSDFQIIKTPASWYQPGNLSRL